MKKKFILLALAAFVAVAFADVTPNSLATARTPNVRSVTSSTAVEVFTAGVGNTIKMVQNNGTNALLYGIGVVPTTSSYHGTIAGGTRARDGLGTSVDFSAVSVPIYVITESGTTEISVLELRP